MSLVSNDKRSRLRVAVVGCGYLGATHAVCMAELGFDVLGVEVDATRLEELSNGRIPFFEPRLGQMLRDYVERGTLRFTASHAEAAAFASVIFLCVGTPQEAEGLGADLRHVNAAVDSLAPHLNGPVLVVGKSTVPVGTAGRLADQLQAESPAGTQARLAWNPEFLREGFAVCDTLSPDRLVFGVVDPEAEATLREIYAQIIDRGTPVVVTNYATAELVKVSANAFLATKISFINAMSEVCDVAGADVVQLADAIGHDVRIGRQFLNAGIGFGGGCLPKDLRALMHRAGQLGVADAVAYLREIDTINQRRRVRVVQLAVEMVGDVSRSRVGVLGAAFKPGSDDIRDSPALFIAGQLQLSGASVSIYDPYAMDNARSAYPTLEYADTPGKACADADVVLHLTDWAEFRDIDPDELGEVVAQRNMIDGRNCLDPSAWRHAGWRFKSFGRP